MFAGQVVAVRNGRGLGGVTSLVNDAHGTALAAVPNTQWTPASVRRLYTGPFGGARGASVDMGTDRQFLGKVRDASTGLTLLGARYYDEVVGRFVSVDPQLEPGVPAQFNAYVYAGNNPLTWSDPTGLFWGSSIVHSVSSWVSSHQAAIVGAVVGVAVGAGCLAATAGAGSIGCAAAAGAAGAAASNLWASKVQHTATFSWSSLARDTVVGAVVGAASAGIGSVAAPALSRAASAVTSAVRTVAPKAASAARSAVGASARSAGAEAAEGASARSAAGSGARACTANSFTGTTLVLMGDGSHKAIKDVALGDEVMATDPETGRAGPRKVVDLIRHAGVHTMVVVQLVDGTRVEATDHHPFWDATRGEWADAVDLVAGEQVITEDGTTLTVTRVTVSQQDLTAYNRD